MDDDLDALESALVAFMHAVFKPKSWTAIQRLAQVDIDRPAASLLMQMHSGDEICPLSQLANKMGVEAPSVTRIAQRLEQDGLITRTTDQHDRRITNVQLSDKGLEVVSAIRRAKRERLCSYIKDWSEQDRRTLIRLLTRLAESAQQS